MPIDPGNAVEGTGLAGAIAVARKDVYGGKYSVTKDANGLNAESDAMATIINAAISGGGGEANTASSAGSGVSLYYQKSGVDLQFNAIKSENDRLSCVLDGATHDIELTVNEGNIVHQNLSGAGTNTHAQIDTHLGSSLNPHGVTYTQVGAAPAAEGVTNGNAHDHTGGAGAQIDHVNLANKGTNTHAQIDTHIGDGTIHYTQAAISITASQVSDFDTEVSNNGDVAANTAVRHNAVTLAASATTGGLGLSTQEISFQAASGSQNGYLTSTDWTTFNNKSVYSDPLTTRGDLLYRNASITTRLPIGTSGKVLRSDGTDAAWATLVAADISDFDTEVSNNAAVAANTSSRHAAVTLATSATDGGLSLSTQEIRFRAASTEQSGYLTSTDWDTFNGKSDYSDPLTTRGDLLYRDVSATTRLALGTSGKVLRSNGTDAAWTTLVAADISDFDTEVSDNTDVAANTAARHAAVTLAASATAGGLGLSTQEISFQAASGSQNGYLTSTDWNTFDGKADAFLDLTDTPSGYTTSNAIYTTNGTPDGVTETTVVLTEGTNTFNIAKGTASLDIAAGAALDVDANLSVEAASAINQDLTSDASPTFTGVTVSGLTASRLLSTNGSKALASVANLSSWIAGTANRLTVGDDGDGSVTLNVDESGLVHNSIGSKQGGTTGEYYHLTQDQNTVVANFDGLYDLGFESATATTLAFNDTTYQFTLGDVGSGWSYWRGGKRITITGDKTITLPGSPPTAGAYYITINADDGTLSQSTTPWTLNDLNMPVALILWDNTKTPKYHLGDERHKAIFQRSVHLYLHKTRGTQWYSGGELSGYVVPAGAPSGDGDNTFGISAAELFDEDIALDLPVLADPSGAVDAYVAYYRTAASTWTWEQSEVPFRYTAAGYVQWDSAGTMTQGVANKYYNWYLAFTDYEGIGRFFCVPGQSQFDSANDAYGEEISELTLTGFSPQELVFAYQMTFATNNSYSTKGKCKLTRAPERIDVSRVESTVGGGTTDHNALGGLQGGTTAQYFHLTNAEHTALVTGVDASSYHIHDSRYYTETEIGSVTGGSEGALLVGTDAKTNLGSATTVEAALNATDTHVGDSTIHFTQGAISIPASQISDFDTEVGNNTDVAANTAARHSAVTLAASATTGGLGLSTQEISFQAATTSQNGYLTSTDWNTFNSKQAALSFGDLTEATSDVLTIVGGTGAVVGSGLTIEVDQADGSNDGYLSSTDWTTFNSKSDYSDPLTTRGDLLVRGASVTTRLAIGTTGKVLRSDGTDPLWTTLVAADVSDFDTEVGNNADVAANTTHRGSTGVDHGYISQDVTSTGTPAFSTVTATTFFGNLDTNVAAAGLTVSGTTIAADGTDVAINVTVTPKGTGYLTVSNAGTYAASFVSSLSAARAVYGEASQTGATTNYGGYFVGKGNSARAVYGYADATGAVGNYGGDFLAAGNSGRGVVGLANATGAVTNYGGHFTANGDYGRAVYGLSGATGAFTNYGGYFTALGDTARTVYGEASASGSVENYGGYFVSQGQLGSGVHGLAYGNEAKGVSGNAAATGAYTSYGGYFVSSTDSGRGVFGGATATGAVTNYGAEFYAGGNSGRGIYAYANATGAVTNYGGYFSASGDSGRGIYATAPATGYSGYFETGAFWVDSSAAITLDADAASSFNVTGADLTVQTVTSGDINLTPAGNVVVTGDILATTFDTNVAAAGLTVSGTTLAADGTDTHIDITITPKGNAGIVFPNAAGAPAVTTNKLYQTGGKLYFDGVDLESQGFVDPMTTRGDIIYRGLSGTTRLGIGLAEEVLMSDGTDPAWTALTAAHITDFDTEVGNNTDVAANTSARHVAVTLAASATAGGLGLSTQEITFQAATTGQNGYLTSTDWNTFDGKSDYADPLTTRGDLLYRNATITTRLSLGTTGKVLRSDGTDAAWTTLVVADISDFDTEVSSNTDVAANTTHRGLTSNPHSVTAAQASAIALALGTTKGDLIVFTGSGTPVRFPVGADGLLLKADSAQTEGVAWASVAGTGDVVGPASAVADNLVAFNGTTGKAIKDSGVSMTTPTFTSVTATNFYTAAAAAGLTIAGSAISADGTDTNINMSITPKGTGKLYIQGEVFTDTVLSLETSTFFGIGATPAGLSHTTGQEGWYNSTFGYFSGNALTTGDSSTFLGYGAGALTSTGQDNTFVGRSSGGANVSGDYNTYMGYLAGNSETGDYNTYIGWAAGRYRNGGIRNTALGAWAMYGGASATGDYNTCIGSHSGSDLTTASYCVCLGYDIEFPSATTNYQLNIANTLKSTNWNGAGDITLHTNSNEVMKVSSAGIHHFPRTSGILVSRTTTQSIPNTTWTTLRFLVEQYDNRSEYNNSDVDGTGGIFTADEEGWYKCSWMTHSENTSWAAGEIWMSGLSKNNSTVEYGIWLGNRWAAPSAHSEVAYSGGSTTIKLAANDTLRIKIFQTQGGAVTTVPDSRYNHFSVQKVA